MNTGGEELSFVRLENPIPANLEVGDPGLAVVAMVVGFAPRGALLEFATGVPVPWGEALLAMPLHDGTFETHAILEPDATRPRTARARFCGLGTAACERLDSFLTRVRKEDHLRLCLGEGVSFREVTSGFERYRLPHRAVPDVDLDLVDLSTSFLGHRLLLPLIVSSMTGGSELARTINRRLAESAQERGIAIGLGSMRILLADPSALDTFDVRRLAPDVPLFANLGAVQLNYGAGSREVAHLVDLVKADGIIFHFNPLQEAVQPEGDTKFGGLAKRLAQVARELSFPKIAKEVGNGISGEVAARLVECGMDAIDVAGASGTSWARIEGKRAKNEGTAALGELFGEWGIPTAQCVVDCRRRLHSTALVASGGVRNGIDAAKAIALGANLVGIARPFLEAASESTERVVEAIDRFARELRVAMFVSGARSVAELSRTRLDSVTP